MSKLKTTTQNSKLKIIFLGTPPFVQPVKLELAKHFTLIDSLNEADLGVVAAYGRILTKEELDTPKYGCINVHPSLLPKYRGPSPIPSAILNGDKISGITIIKMDEEVDHGPIIYQEQIELSDSDNFDTLSKKMFLRAAEILPKVIEDFVQGKMNYRGLKDLGILRKVLSVGFIRGLKVHGFRPTKIKPTAQNHHQASYCERLVRESGYFDLNSPPPKELLDRMIRAYYPWPGVWTRFRQGSSGQARIVKLLPKGLVQMEGKKAMPLRDFLNGYPDFPLKNVL